MGEVKEKRKPPQGRKKGGTIFPRINLEDAIGYAGKLVSKTHIGPQPEGIVLPGVFGSGGSTGKIKASALKQYGLLQGTSAAYSATELAKQLSSAPPEDRIRLLQQVCLGPKVFKLLFDTFHGDTVSLARVRQQVATAGVHPDELDNCSTLFTVSVQFAKLGTLAGDSLTLQSNADVSVNESAAPPDKNGQEPDAGETEEASAAQPEHSGDGGSTNNQSAGAPATGTASGRSVIHVNVSIDSSLDTEKLEKQLALLRRYGAI